MEFQQIESFVLISKERNFSRAAELMHISQSTISARIKNLEIELGVPLFIRTGRDVQLSSFGITFLPFAEHCLETMRRAKMQLEKQSKAFKSRLRIGVTNPFASYVLPSILPEIYTKFPTYDIQILKKTHSEDILQLINDEQIDLGFVNNSERLPIDESYISNTSLYHDSLVLLSNPNHGLSRQLSIGASHLTDQKFILLAESHISELIQKFLTDHGIEPNSTIYINHTEAIKKIIASEHLLTILPHLVVTEELKRGHVVKIPLTAPLPVLKTSLIYLRNHDVNQSLLGLIEAKIIDYVEQLKQDHKAV